MRLFNPSADVYIPDGADLAAAAERTTHLCIGAHPDDAEIMAYHGIAQCFGRTDRWFTNVTVTNGAGSPRSDPNCSDERMREIRRLEQRKAAKIGEYSVQFQLDYSAASVKDPAAEHVTQDLVRILTAARPQVVYAHNPADEHETHVAVFLRSLAALRRLPARTKPARVYGCEVWRGLEWLPDARKQALPVDDHPDLAASLIGVFESQIAGGKRYDLAIAGRRLANATFLNAHETDQAHALTYAIDLTPLIDDPALSVVEFIAGLVEELKQEVLESIRRLG
jgi:LmbE family N-acetylglucosaminyl deacetylase